jgi:predicted enzyme related to lactoylglutathione lyase
MGPTEEPSAWTTYLAASNADETAAKIKASGGQVLVEPMDVMEQGRMAIAADPGGAVFGLWQAGQHTGVRLANVPGSLTWNENLSRDFDGNKAFYQAVFGFEYGDIGDTRFRYATLKSGGSEVGGIGELDSGLPAEVPAHWSAYFAVEDTDAAVADDHGAVFSLISAPADST